MNVSDLTLEIAQEITIKAAPRFANRVNAQLPKSELL